MTFGKQVITSGESDDQLQARLAQEAVVLANKKNQQTLDLLATATQVKTQNPGRDATILTQGTYSAPSTLNGPGGNG